MNYQQVFQRFIELANLTDEEAEKYRWLCNNAVEELNEMLVKGIDKEACSGRLTATAGAIAFYKYSVISQDGNVNSIKAGEITVNCTPLNQYAGEYLNQCMKSIAPYVKDKNFLFRGVKTDDLQFNL